MLRRLRATHLQGPWVGVQISRGSRVQLQILVRPYGNGLDRDVRFDAHRGCQNHQRSLRRQTKITVSLHTIIEARACLL